MASLVNQLAAGLPDPYRPAMPVVPETPVSRAQRLAAALATPGAPGADISVDPAALLRMGGGAATYDEQGRPITADTLGQAQQATLLSDNALKGLWTGSNPDSPQWANGLAGGLGTAMMTSPMLGMVTRMPLFHGSPATDLKGALTESTRGPLGPGVYTSPVEGVAKSYAGDEGMVYQLPTKARDIYTGAGHRTDEEWHGYKEDSDRLIAAAEPDKQGEVKALVDKMWSGDGYPLFNRLAQLYGSQEAAQALFKRAGFEGIAAQVDGPETLLFGQQPLPIRAYHGSPYDFDAFSMDKIGTGEGAQAYGHGLYFAEEPKVADGYRGATTQHKWTYEGKPSAGSLEASSLHYLDPRVVQKVGIPAAIQEAVGRLKDSEKFYDQTYGTGSGSPNLYTNVIKNLQKLDPAKVAPAGKTYGKTYEVAIDAHPDEFLDWDKPLSEQPKAVQNAIAKSGLFGDATAEDIGQLGVTGEHAYHRAIAERSGGPVFPGGGTKAEAADVTEALRAAGIKGIRYADQGSRGWRILTPEESVNKKYVVGKWPGGGPEQKYFDNARDAQAYYDQNNTNNYVVFDDKTISILKKYGLAGLTAGGAAAAVATGNYPTEQHPQTKPPPEAWFGVRG